MISRLAIAIIAIACSQARPLLFHCPSAELISPCLCRELHAFSLVSCTGFSSLEDLQHSLAHHFPSPIPWLQIADSNFLNLSPGAFYNVSISRLVINSTNLRHITDEAFAGLENTLGLLAIQESKIFEVPSPALARLVHLQTLSFAGNRITHLGHSDFHSLPNLKNIVLTNNQISVLERGVFTLPGGGLRTLSLSQNQLTTFNGTVRNLERLEWLLAANNRLTSVDGELDGLVHLVALNLANNLLTDLGDSLRDCIKLHDLNVAYNNLKHLGDSMHYVPHLQYLNASNNHLSELEESEFMNLTRLQRLDLSCNRVSFLGSSVQPLRSLQSLNLSHNSLSALDHKELQWLRSLRELDVSHNQLTMLDETFGHDLSKVVSLHLSDNHIESLHGCLKHLHDLRMLDLSFNHLTSLGKHDIPSTGRLHVVRLSGNPWVCDGTLTHTLQDMDTRLISVEGRPLCSLVPDGI